MCFTGEGSRPQGAFGIPACCSPASSFHHILRNSFEVARCGSQVKEPGHRARLVFNLKRFEASEPWTLENIEQHVERRDSDYAGGQPLAACGCVFDMSYLE